MTAQPLAPVIPSSAVTSARQRARSAVSRPLPLARPVFFEEDFYRDLRFDRAIDREPEIE